jgi:hypothetical protein
VKGRAEAMAILRAEDDPTSSIYLISLNAARRAIRWDIALATRLRRFASANQIPGFACITLIGGWRPRWTAKMGREAGAGVLTKGRRRGQCLKTESCSVDAVSARRAPHSLPPLETAGDLSARLALIDERGVSRRLSCPCLGARFGPFRLHLGTAFLLTIINRHVLTRSPDCMRPWSLPAAPSQ